MRRIVNDFLTEIYMGLSWDIKWHKHKTFIPGETKSSNSNFKEIFVDVLPSNFNFLEMLELKTGRLFKLSLDLYSVIVDSPDSRKSIFLYI